MLFLLFIFSLINLYYWIAVFPVFSFHKPISQKKGKFIFHNQKVTVVICARNESHNLKRNLPMLLEQEGPEYQLIVIDDASTDDSIMLLEGFQAKYHRLKIIKNGSQLGKKQSLHRVLPRIDTDVFIMTDGDCKPASSNWLAHMLEALEEEKDIVLGFGPFVKKKGLLNLFARFENFMTAIQYFSYTLMGNPYMGVGRNLLYRKSVFNRAKGFSDHLNKLGGDDDLLINKMGDHHNTALQFEKESFMYSEAPASWRTFFKQKKRHIGASFMYKRKHQFNLSLFAGSHVLFYVFLFLFSWQISLVFWLTRLIIILALNRMAFSKLGQKDLIIYFPLLDFMIFVYYCIMALYSILQPKTNSWK